MHVLDYLAECMGWVHHNVGSCTVLSIVSAPSYSPQRSACAWIYPSAHLWEKLMQPFTRRLKIWEMIGSKEWQLCFTGVFTWCLTWKKEQRVMTLSSLTIPLTPLSSPSPSTTSLPALLPAEILHVSKHKGYFCRILGNPTKHPWEGLSICRGLMTFTWPEADCKVN